MPIPRRLSVVALLLCAAVASDAFAARRGVRIDFGQAWTTFPGAPIGSAGCPGSSASHTRITRGGITYSGYDNNAYLAGAYCQSTVPGEYDAGDVNFDEPGLAALVGDNSDNHVSAIRYTYADGEATDPSNNRFQWAFYTFDNGVTLVALYGLVDDGGTPTPITDATSYIRQGGTTLWGGGDGLDDEYFCFVDGAFVGLWSGDVAEPGACMARFATFFEDGFESP